MPVTPSSLPANQIQEIMAHPRFEELVRAIFFGRQIGEDPEKQRSIAEQHKKTVDSILRARMELQSQQRSPNATPDLDLLLVCNP